MLGRLHGGAQGGAAGIGDRGRRQALDGIGVIGRGDGEIGMAERVAERMRAVAEREGDGGVGLQPHAKLQTIDEDSGDARPLVLTRRLLLHQRREDERFARARQWQVGATPGPRLGERSRHRPTHATHDLLPLVAIGKEIGVGQQRALLLGRRDGAVERVVGAQ